MQHQDIKEKLIVQRKFTSTD